YHDSLIVSSALSMPIVGTSYPHEVPTIDEFCRRTVTDGDQPFVGCKSTFEYPSSRLSNRAYASGASASGSSFDTTKLGVARPATIMSRSWCAYCFASACPVPIFWPFSKNLPTRKSNSPLAACSLGAPGSEGKYSPTTPIPPVERTVSTSWFNTMAG